MQWVWRRKPLLFTMQFEESLWVELVGVETVRFLPHLLQLVPAPLSQRQKQRPSTRAPANPSLQTPPDQSNLLVDQKFEGYVQKVTL